MARTELEYRYRSVEKSDDSELRARVLELEREKEKMAEHISKLIEVTPDTVAEVETYRRK